MPESQQTYMYRAGQKVALEKAPDQFMERAAPEESEDSLHPSLAAGGRFQVSEQGSPAQLGQDIARAVYGGMGA